MLIFPIFNTILFGLRFYGFLSLLKYTWKVKDIAFWSGFCCLLFWVSLLFGSSFWNPCLFYFCRHHYIMWKAFAGILYLTEL